MEGAFFHNLGPATWQAASAVIHETTECPSFTANDMADEWKRIWCPDESDYDEEFCAEKWKSYVAVMMEPLPRSGHDSEWRPSMDDFRSAVKRITGGAGYDGWHSTELKLIATVFEFLLSELYELWCDTCEHLLLATADRDLQRLIFSWRVVGVPKKDPTQSRPIGVASVLLRAWLTACEPSLPDPQNAQFACKSGTSVIHACCLWLHACELGQCGMERDLSKCYDNVPRAVAATSLQVAAVPRRVSAVAQAAWKGPRVFQVAGEPAREPLWPKMGLPQGDSAAPKGSVQCLGSVGNARQEVPLYG